jgi:hypothetical protein
VVGFIWFTNAGDFLRGTLQDAVFPIVLEPAPVLVESPAEQRAPAPAPSANEPPRIAAPASAVAAPAVTTAVAGGDVVTTGSGAGAARADESIKTRLATPPVDPRLKARTEPLPAPPLEAARLRVAERMRPFNDSIAAEEKAHANKNDWTRTDAQGKRWGVVRESKEKGVFREEASIQLGGVKIPLFQSHFATPRHDELHARLNMHNAIEQGATRAEIRDTFNARVQAIRKRKAGNR